MDNTESVLREALQEHGAREFEMVALMLDPHRGLAALNYAVMRGVDRVIPYAIKVFDNPDWQPSGEKRRMATNQAVERRCSHCGGDRFVPVVDDWSTLYAETYAPCKVCNAGTNTSRFVGDERRETVPR